MWSAMCSSGVGNGKIKHFTSTGTLVDTLDTRTVA